MTRGGDRNTGGKTRKGSIREPNNEPDALRPVPGGGDPAASRRAFGSWLCARRKRREGSCPRRGDGAGRQHLPRGRQRERGHPVPVPGALLVPLCRPRCKRSLKRRAAVKPLTQIAPLPGCRKSESAQILPAASGTGIFSIILTQSTCLQCTHFIFICDAFDFPNDVPRHRSAVFLASEHRREHFSASALAPARRGPGLA